MRYIISDIHGCYDELMLLLEKIEFSDKDELYVLGDVVDRGPEPIKTLKFLMGKSNIHFILGNHDFIMHNLFYRLLRKYETLENDDDLTFEELNDIMRWTKEGGGVTINQFLEEPIDVQIEIMEYLMNASSYGVLEHEGKRYVLVHAGIHGYDEQKKLCDYPASAFIYERIDYSKPLFKDENTYLVTGHTPTPLIRADNKPWIYKKNGHIAIDCGCVFGGKLAAYCIETNEEFYVDCL